MSREEVQKLLGGYATGTLTAEEQQALFEAALDDQELFDTLAREQALRDLLRDPAANAAVLAALDERPRLGLWAWLRRPVVAGVAMAGLAAIGVALWQGTRKPAAPVIVAQLQKQTAQTRMEPRATAPVTAPAPAPAQPFFRDEKRAAGALRRVAPARAPAPPPVVARQRETLDANAPVVPLAKPPQLNLTQQSAQNAAGPAPYFQNTQIQNAQIQATQVPAPASLAEKQQAKTEPSQDARALFYQQLPVTGRNGFAAFDATIGDVGGVAGAAPAGVPETARAKAAKKAVPAESLARLAPGLAGAYVMHPGVRCSILRGDREEDISTVLPAGESVRLRITPNTDGFLSVYEGEGDSAKLLASGPAQRMKAFETPPLKSDTAGLKQIRVTLTLVSMMKAAPSTSDAGTRSNLVESAADKEAATYMVLKDARPATQQVVMPITLTWR